MTPYRPSVSTPAALSAPGWLELETGVPADRGNAASRRDSVPFTLKLAFTPDWGIRLGGEVWVRQTDDAGAALEQRGIGVVVLYRADRADRTFVLIVLLLRRAGARSAGGLTACASHG